MGSIYPGGKEHILLQVRKSDLCVLFGVSKHTIDAWIRDKKLNIRSLSSICEWYHKRQKVSISAAE